MELPSNEHIIDFKMTGEGTLKVYEGQFTVLCLLDMFNRHLLEVEKTRLQADMNNPTEGLAGMALILSTLRVKIVDGPVWWQQSAGGFDIKDEEVIVALYTKVQEAEDIWRKKVRDQAEDLKKKEEEKKSKETDQ